MEKLFFDNTFFNIADTLECGQIFRFKPRNNGYLVFSLDKCAYVCNDQKRTVIECEKRNVEYFKRFFDLDFDYSSVYDGAKSFGVDILATGADYGKGIRILNQDCTEALFSFIISQNNNIPRIKGIIERLCEAIGESKSFGELTYHAFPTVQALANQSLDFYKSIGLGYRAEYVYALAKSLTNGFDVKALNDLDTKRLKKELVSLYGVGPKVADCVVLFGYHRGDSFPVDTWIKKVYKEDFNGKLNDTSKISDWFVNMFKNHAGYYQQYLFHYKRNQENKTNSKI